MASQRRHQAGYVEVMKRIQDGAIGDVVAARCYWNQGGLWKRDREASWSDVEWQVLGASGLARLSFRKRDDERVSRLHSRRGAGHGTAVDGDRPRVDQALEPVARDTWDV